VPVQGEVLILNVSAMVKRKSQNDLSELLKGWAAIAKFLGLTPATVQRWARAGMPVRREGRFTVANRAELEKWIAKESGMPKPAHVLTGDADISAALKDSIKAVRHTVKQP
jgi:hypothetical protein